MLIRIPGVISGHQAGGVVVVGVVWQLRPADPLPPHARGDGDVGYVTAEIIQRLPTLDE